MSSHNGQMGAVATPCPHFIRGYCSFGNRCWNIHDATLSRWRGEGGDLEEEIRRTREVRQELEAFERIRIARQEARNVQQEAARAKEAARRLELAKEEAAVTIQQVVLDSTVVTFGAGFAIRHILTGFESRRIRVKNIPADANIEEVSELFTQQGIDRQRFHVVEMKRTFEGDQEAVVIGDDDLELVAIAFESGGLLFREEELSFDVLQTGPLSEGMKPSAPDTSNVLTISWPPPAVPFVVTYPTMRDAYLKAEELDGTVCGGRMAKVAVNTRPPGVCISNFSPNAVKIRALHPDVTDEEVARFSGSSDVQRLKPITYDVTHAPDILRRYMEAESPGCLRLFEDVSDRTTTDGRYIFRAHYDTWRQAKHMSDFLGEKRHAFLGGNSLLIRLPDPVHYTIIIPSQRFKAQERFWNSLVEDTRDKEGQKVSVAQADNVHFIRLGGEDKKAVGSLKVRIEKLAAGETLAGYHESLDQEFLDIVYARTGASLHADRRLRVLKAYGSSPAVDAARVMVDAEIAWLEGLEETFFLERCSVGFFMQRGLAAIKEELGKDNVTLDMSSLPFKIIIKGGDSARHTLDRYIQESLESPHIATGIPATKCPICYDDINVDASSVRLGCDHVYCTACIRHFLASASTFPLSCIGDEDKCRVPISIPTIQRFLLPHQVAALLGTAFNAHMEHHPQDFKYCTTPDCRQIYQCNKSANASVIHCPSCLSAVCPSCYEKGHEGMTCAERKLYNDPAEQERLNDELARTSGFKKCPGCAVLIEKIDGCNHMSCKCGAHICWVCMGIFTSESIYAHMNTVHGGIGVEH